MKKKCVIIGSGLGGLSSGVIMAKNGYDVTILEQGLQIGGCMQCFSRNGAKFETGMHFVGSLDDGQILSNYFNYLEIKDKLKFRRLDVDSYDIVSLNGEHFRFANGRENFINTMVERFPDQKENLEHYCDLVEKVAITSLFRFLDDTTPQFVDNELMIRSLSDVIDTTITDPLLRDVLVGNIALYAAEREKTPFASHAFVFDFYNSSAFRIVGGSDNIAKALVEVLHSYGGRVYASNKVVKIITEGNMAVSVKTENGDVFPADLVFSDIHPSLLLDLLDISAVTPAYRNRVQSIKNTTSVFSLYLHFKENVLPYMNSNFYSIHSDSPWEMDGTFDSKWPKGYLYMHHCMEENQKYAKSGIIFAYLSASELSAWNDTEANKRGTDYEMFKKKCAERILDVAEKDFPGLKDSIASYYTATPLTYRDYIFSPEGAIYGLVKDVTTGIVGRVSYRTKVQNLLLIGQSINFHGSLGVLVGSLMACSSVLGEENVKRQVVEANRKKVVIIGGGIGGLVSGALLSKEGFRVTVLEKNPILGGGLQCFKRNGVTFSTCMHTCGGFQSDGSLQKICKYLGILDRISLRFMDEDGFAVITCLSDNEIYRLPEGRENYVNYLVSRFPKECDGIKAYIDKLYQLSEEEDLYYLRKSDKNVFMHSEMFFWPIEKLISYYISDKKLQSLLYCLSPLYGGVLGETPAYINALISVLYINGSCQFNDGSQQVADLLKEVIETAGGKVLINKKITEIVVENHQVTSVKTEKETFKGDLYISDVHPDILLKVISEKAFPPSFKNRLNDIPNTYSNFSVFIKFKENSFQYFNHMKFCIDDYESVWHLADYDKNSWPKGLLYTTPPVRNQGDFAQTMIICCVMDYNCVKAWENTTYGNRGAAYEQWKQEHLDKVLNKMERIYPEFRKNIECTFASSPLTIRDFYGNKNGSLFGLRKDCNNMTLSQLSPFTKVKNLFLTGQNVNIHGFCGVSLTAIETIEAIVGRNVIVEKIIENNETK